MRRNAVSWFDSHEVSEKLGHTPQWLGPARALIEERMGKIDKFPMNDTT